MTTDHATTPRTWVAIDPRATGPEQRVLRWGAHAGVLGSTLLLATVGLVTALGLPDVSDVESLQQFPDIQVARTVENGLYLGALVGWAAHHLALYRVLHRVRPAPALFGTALSLMGLVALMAGSLLHVATAPLSELYHAAGADVADRAAAVAGWLGAQAVFDTLLTTGGLLAALGAIGVGLALRHDAGFGAVRATVATALGAVGAVGGAVSVVDPGSPAIAASIVALTVFHLVTGWRLHTRTRGATDTWSRRRAT